MDICKSLITLPSVRGEIHVKAASGCAIVQAVSCWLLTVGAQVELQGYLCEICGGKMAPGQVCCRSFSVLLCNLAFLKLWSADHKWSSGSALVVLLD